MEAPGPLTITPAAPSELEDVIALYREAAQWLIARGIHQWPAHGVSPTFILPRIERGEVYLARLRGETAGTLRLQPADPVIWMDVPDDALYTHGLVVRRAFAGRGLGLELLRWAEDQAARAGKTSLRLDCWDGNLALRDYYTRAGFTDCGFVQEKTWECRLFEKKVACNLSPASVSHPSSPHGGTS